MSQSVTFNGVSLLYPGGSAPAVSHLDLEIGAGEFLVLVGPSGCGKSSCLRLLAGLETVSEGTILIGDRDVTHIDAKDRDIAMVFQNYALYPHMTVAENMGFALKIANVAKSEVDRRVQEAAQLLDLTDYLERKPKALSGGQRQRVAMGRAIVREPHVFLMDEPLSNLDARLRVHTRAQIAALQARLGATTMYVTHDQVEAMTMGDRVAVLKSGVLQQVGTPAEVYNQPINAFVASFIGSPSMNLIPARITPDGAAMHGYTFDLDSASLARASSNRVLVGIRPEDLHLADRGIEMTVTLVENLGADTYVYGTATSVHGTSVELVMRDKITPAIGTTVKVWPSRTFAFDVEDDQKRLL